MSNPHTASGRGGLRVLAPLAFAALLLLSGALVASELAAGMFRPWNDARLAPSAGLLHGYALYAAPGETGPIWSWIYGPVAPLVYLPAVLFPTPAGALAIALVATASIYLAAARGLLARSTSVRGPWYQASFVALVLYTLAEPALRGAAFWIHADGPAIGFAALACCAISAPERRHRPAALALSALACVLAIATKQVLLPLPIALLAVLAGSTGRRASAIWLGWAAAGSAAAMLVFGAAFGFAALRFNLVTIPLAHPWQWGGGAGALARAGGELLVHALPLLAVTAVCWPRGHDADDRAGSPRRLLLWVALALSLGAVLTRVKVGAGANAHSFALFFLAAAAAGMLADACASSVSRSRLAGRLGLAVALAACLALTAPALAQLPGLVRALPGNPESSGFALASARPGTLYFPTHPLVTLYAEGRASHVSYGIFDRALAGHPVDDAHFRAFTAPQLEQVALWATAEDYVLRRLPALTQAEPYGPQPGWQLVRAPSERATGEGPRDEPAASSQAGGEAAGPAGSAHSRP